MSTYDLLGLYPHNIETCKKVKEAFDNGEDIVSIIRATGTGKSYIGLNLSLEHKDEKIIWLVPTNAIKEHLEQIINNNPNLSIDKDFPNLEIRTYSSLVNLSDEEIEDIDCDLLIVDELHHIGAPVWGEKVNTLIYTHPDIKTFGMSAYSVRDRGTAYERDITNPDTEEIFSDTVVDRYDLYDAIIDGILPFPIVKTVLTENSNVIEDLQESLKVQKLTKKKIQHEIEVVLDSVNKTIHKQEPIKEIIKDAITEDGKYIYFCPVLSYDGINDIESIKEKVVSYIKEKYPNKRIVVYQTTSDIGSKGEMNRDCFYHDIDLDGKDVSDTIRIMFAKNQYNEGVHAPNVDGVFLGRETESDIVALEQIGRALSVRENIKEKRKEYNSFEINQLKNIANKRKIFYEDDITKEQLVELLLSPVIIDLTGNISFLEELENNLKDRVKEKRKSRRGTNKRLDFIEKQSLLMVEAKQKSFIKALLNLHSLVRRDTWDEYYDLAVTYYKNNGNSEIPISFKTINGIDVDNNGVNLGYWCNKQRDLYKNNKLDSFRIEKLEKIDFRFKTKEKRNITWDEYYKLALIYYKHYNTLEIPQKFKTNDGINYDKDGTALGHWCNVQRINYKNNKLSQDRKDKLDKIGFRFINIHDVEWQNMYELAMLYFNYYGNSEVTFYFKTKDGVHYDKDGYALGSWFNKQRYNYNQLSEDRKEKLDKINFRIEANKYDLDWQNMYELAILYFNHYGNSNVPNSFKTKDGVHYDEDGVNLGQWCITQRVNYEKLSSDRKEKLKNIKFRFEDKRDIQWENMYELALLYFNHYGNSEIPDKFKTKNGIDYHKDGYSVGAWCTAQRSRYKENKLADDQKKKLEIINFRFDTNKLDIDWENMYELAMLYFKKYNNLDITQTFKTKDGVHYDEDGVNLGIWMHNQRYRYKTKRMSLEQYEKLEKIGFKPESKSHNEKWQDMYELALSYYKKYGHSEIPSNFKTKNGIDYDDKGMALGYWCNNQRQRYEKLEKDKIEKLSLISFRFVSFRKLSSDKLELCNSYNLDYNKYKILQLMSYQELYSKIMFLLDNNLSLEVDNKLHEIFTMSNENMILKYFISKEELIKKYYINFKRNTL